MIMDIVYVVGGGSRWKNNELRYSLRSLENFEHRNVVIVGEKPDWCQNVIHIEMPDVFANVHGGRYKNVMRKTIAACEDERVSDDFVLMNDDFFFLEKTKSIKPYSIGKLSSQIEEYKRDNRNQYGNALLRTQRMLSTLVDHDPDSYAIHYPIVYNKKNFIHMAESFDWLEKPCSWRTLYGNIHLPNPIRRDDPKIHNEEQLEYFLKCDCKGDFLSISDSVAVLPKFQNWLAETFSNESKYETN